jgi:hypothetical protein
MGIHGSTLSFPFRVDARGTLATVSDPAEIAEQFLRDLIETRLGERVMLPGYGLPDHIFAVKNAGFTVQLAAELEEQARNYLTGTIRPLLQSIEVSVGEVDNDGAFEPGFSLDPHLAAISVTFQLQGDNTERNLVFPTFQFRGEAA